MSKTREVQKERSSVYGEFTHQSKCVGSIVNSLIDCSIMNGNEPTDEQVGAFAYMAVKLARYAVTPEHSDTTLDMTIYSSLIHEMHQGEKLI